MSNKKMRAIIEIFLATSFVVLLWIPTFGWLFDWDRAYPLMEKRKLAELPTTPQSLEAFWDFPSGFESYFNDHFGLRSRFIRWHNRIKIRWLGVTPSPQVNVLLGKKGWLFYTGDQVLDYHRGVNPFSPDELATWRRVLEERRDWLAARGVPYLVVFTPNAHTVYPEFLPDWLGPPGPKTRLDQLIEYMHAHSQVEILDLRQTLLEAKKLFLVYHRTDSHWNLLGAHAAYTKIAGRLAQWFPGIEPFPLSAFTIRWQNVEGGDLAMMLDQQRDFSETVPAFAPRHPSPARQVDAGYLTTTHPWLKDTEPVVTECPQYAVPRAVVFRDSSGQALIPFLAEHFGRAVYLWGEFDTRPIESERPAVVLEVIAERKLATLQPTNPPELVHSGNGVGPAALLADP